ncbi:MAG: hypothetical protein ACAH05_06815 [Methylophilus sp.]|nr:hypothetical protein [Methylophilus sp.]
MRKLILMMLVVSPLMTSSLVNSAWAAEKAAKPGTKPPVNNAVPPCDNSPNSKKPSCDMDSDSVNVPPKMPHERGVIVPPEVPAEGLPNREKSAPLEPVQELPDSHDNHLKN